MVTKICVGNYVGDIYHPAEFYPNRFRGFGSAHDSAIFWFLRKATAETRAPILTQNTSNDAVPCKEVPFGGRETISTPIFPKTAIFGPHFDGTWIFFARKRL